METRRKAAWGEGALLGLTGLFLCLLLGLFLRDRAAMEAPASVETALTAPVEAGPVPGKPQHRGRGGADRPPRHRGGAGGADRGIPGGARAL